MLIDTHTHLNMEPLAGAWRGYVETAYKAGVGAVIVPGSGIENSRKAAGIAIKSRELDLPVKVYATAGIHPEEVDLEAVKELSELVKQTGVVGVGEIGLDYHLLDNHQDLIPVQRQIFKEQLDLAKKHDLAVIVHTRRSQAIYDACDDIAEVFGSTPFKGVFHSFTGGISHYRRIAELGAYIGVNGLITYDHNSSLRKVISGIPIERMVLETDAPWLVPSPVKAEYNQPAYVTVSALKLSEVLSVPLSRVIMTTTHNAKQLFGLS